MIRVGTVSSYDKDTDTARIYFPDLQIVSGNLKVVRQPVKEGSVSVELSGYAEINGRDTAGEYDENDVNIEGDITIEADDCAVDLSEGFAWIPEIGQTVICVFLEGGDGDGYILGKV